MNPRSLTLSGAALGALALSCAGMQMPSLPTTPAEIGQTVGTTVLTMGDRAECEKLNAEPSLEEEYALGGSVAINWVQRGDGLIPVEGSNQKVLRYLNIVGRNLGAQSPRPTLRWTFGVIQNTESFNAVSAPGGYIFVTLGLLQGVENEAQLAGVLAHEIAHVAGKHALARYSQVKVEQCKLAVTLQGGKKLGQQQGLRLTPKAAESLLAALGSPSGGLNLDKDVDLLGILADEAVETLAENGLGKEDEYAADAMAVQLLLSAGYDPREYLEFLRKIPESRSAFANHPRKADRIKALVKLLDSRNRQPGADFPKLPDRTEGLVTPPLPREFAAVKGAVARDTQ